MIQSKSPRPRKPGAFVRELAGIVGRYAFRFVNLTEVFSPQDCREDKDMEDGGGWVDDRELTWACWELRGTIENEELHLAERDAAAAKLEELAKAGDAHAQYFLGLVSKNSTVLTMIRATQKWAREIDNNLIIVVKSPGYSLGSSVLCVAAKEATHL